VIEQCALALVVLFQKSVFNGLDSLKRAHSDRFMTMILSLWFYPPWFCWPNRCWKWFGLAEYKKSWIAGLDGQDFYRCIRCSVLSCRRFYSRIL